MYFALLQYIDVKILMAELGIVDKFLCETLFVGVTPNNVDVVLTVPQLYSLAHQDPADKSVKNSTAWQHGKNIEDYSYAAGYSTISKSVF